MTQGPAWWPPEDGDLQTETDPTDHDAVKRGVELAVAAKFIEYLRSQGQAIGSPSAGDPRKGEPDAVCETPSGIIGIEVAGAYYDDEEAANTWALHLGQPERSKRYWDPRTEPAMAAVRRAKVIKDPTTKLIDNLNRTLADHSRKNYVVPSYLLLDGRAGFITTSEEGPAVAAELKVPLNQPFIGIFLALGRNWSAEVDFFPVGPRTR